MTPEVGKLITDKAFRDAIHVAIAPANAMETLLPGQHVAYRYGDAYAEGEFVGIVDPFLREPVKKGEAFWLFLYPNTVTSLRHAWTHPAFAITRVVEK